MVLPTPPPPHIPSAGPTGSPCDTEGRKIKRGVGEASHIGHDSLGKGGVGVMDPKKTTAKNGGHPSFFLAVRLTPFG